MKNRLLTLFVLLLTPFFSLAASGADAANGGSWLDLTDSLFGYLAIIIFAFAYLLVIFEEQLHLRKSKPVLIAAGLIWMIIAVVYKLAGQSELVEQGIRHNFLEYTELFFFLLGGQTPRRELLY